VSWAKASGDAGFAVLHRISDKAFTATSIAMLVDEGKMAWDDPVRKHLDYFHLADPLADANVTLRDLLTHRTGLGTHNFLWMAAPWSLEESIRRIGKVRRASPSGPRITTRT